MKEIYVIDLKNTISVGSNIVLFGWITAKRKHKNVIFLDVCDSTGSIQVIIDSTNVSKNIFELAKKILLESAIKVEGTLIERKDDNGEREIIARVIAIIGAVSKQISPRPRSNINIFDSNLVDHLLKNRHLYIRNKKVMAILQFRHTLLGIFHQWFRDNGFIEITAPILTPSPLYDDNTTISLQIHKEYIFLTQCVAFYLESAVHAFEKVYNIGPSFRGEESRGRRYLMEYWHIKAEIAFCNLEDLISLVETIIKYVVERCLKECVNIPRVVGTKFCTDGLNIPFPRIPYRDGVEILRNLGYNSEFGKSFGSEEETILSSKFDTPFWITNLPRNIEPFPYSIDDKDNSLTKTADLIATKGYGELLGVAEKITNLSMLDERMQEKRKADRHEYVWLRELREIGCVPHAGFGMGFERFIRWLLQLPHVRDAVPFPRIFRRKIYP